jgi:hypothetical protein
VLSYRHSFQYILDNTQLGSSGEEYDDDHTECLLTFIAQMDPKGWVWKMFGYQQASLQKVSHPACVFVLIYFAPRGIAAFYMTQIA